MQTGSESAGNRFRLQHPDERMNHRSVYLRTLPLLIAIPAAVLIGALLAGLIYTGVIVSVRGQRQYRQTSKFYINFDRDVMGETYDHYNAATWDDLLIAQPLIRDEIEQGLPSGMTMDEARQDMEAVLLSDIRLMTVYVTTPVPEDTLALSEAVKNGLIRFGNEAKEFTGIDYLSSTEPELVTVSDRTQNAAVLGALLGGIAACFWIRIHVLLDDAVYTPEEAAQRYQLPAVAVTDDGRHALPAFLTAENKVFLASLRGTKPILLSLVSEGEAGKANASLGNAFECRAFRPQDTAQDAVNGRSEKTQQPAGQDKACYILIPYGQCRGTLTEHELSRLRSAGVSLTGLILTGADGRFLSAYYRVK